MIPPSERGRILEFAADIDTGGNRNTVWIGVCSNIVVVWSAFFRIKARSYQVMLCGPFGGWDFSGKFQPAELQVNEIVTDHLHQCRKVWFPGWFLWKRIYIIPRYGTVESIGKIVHILSFRKHSCFSLLQWQTARNQLPGFFMSSGVIAPSKSSTWSTCFTNSFRVTREQAARTHHWM